MRRVRRWGKRLGFLLIELVIVLTLASVVYNAATADRIKPAAALYDGPFLRIQGKLVAYRSWGRRGSPIVLIGGFVEPSFVWDASASLLARTHRVFAVDLPPFGFTERKGPYTLRGWVSLVRAFDDRLGLRRPIIVGHSLGAAVAVAVALWHRADTRAIVLLDGDAVAIHGAPRWASDFLIGPWVTTLYRIATGSDWIFRLGLAGAYPDHPPFTHAFIEQWERPFKVQGTLEAFRSMLQHGIPGFRLRDLRRVHAHTLVLWGARDTVDSVAAGRSSAAALDAPFRTLAGAGHLSMLAAPRALARAIDAFARG
jgi:pimeloyl-ACP methyl ester carboxylesterase